MSSFFRKNIITLIFAFSYLAGLGQMVNGQSTKIDLSGEWAFQSDPADNGLQEKWYAKPLAGRILLPGSMTTNNLGRDIDVNTPWTGSIFDSSWFIKPEYAKYRQPGNIKIPFWLQPIKYYVGAAWYQKTIKIPSTWQKKHIELNIERSHWETTVWIDGEAIGMQNSLSTAQVFGLHGLKPGTHRLTVRVDNRIKEINVGPNSHSITDHTQTNWNGMIGKLNLSARPLIYVDQVELNPNIKGKKVVTKIWLKNISGAPVTASLSLFAVSDNPKAERLKVQKKEITIAGDSSFIEWSYLMGSAPMLWDEFHPSLYSMQIRLSSKNETDEQHIQFGMKEFKVDGTQFAINGRKTFLRGTLECAIFPLTGYPPTDAASWMRIFDVAKSYGLNHLRFHSWCPPEAAFDAADRFGFYLQIECASWANWGTSVGDGEPIDQYLYDESNRIVKAYGNHPSFCMMLYGNEPGGKNQVPYLTAFVNYWKQKDPRRIYSTGSGWPAVPENNFNVISDPRIQHWEEGLKSIINRESPKTNYDWHTINSKYSIPTVSHEIGQWCVYPDFKEIKKYSGVLKAKNFEIFQDKLEEAGLGHLADSFLLASGKLQSLCYKADIEAALRTQGFGGFQLLDLHDFPGQGTAMVGVLNTFWQEKGYITGKEYSRFCNTVVPLVRLSKMVYLNNEDLVVPVEIAQYGEKDLKGITPAWTLKDDKGVTIFSGHLAKTDIPVGNGISLGEINQSLGSITRACKLTLNIVIAGYQNSWDVFVYPASLPMMGEEIYVTQELNAEAIRKLDDGGKVLLSIKKGNVKKEKGGNIAVGFSSIFWNTAWTHGQAPHTLGILCNPNHPALNHFPTDYYSNWQWWDAMTHSDAIILDSVQKNLQPIVRVIDDWVTARSLGSIFECKVGNGRLLLSSIDLITDNEKRPEARQLLFSLMKYMESGVFDPRVNVEASKITSLFD